MPEEIEFPVIESGFNFECTQCGDCCRGDQQVFLNLLDLYNMALFSGFTSTDRLFKQGTAELAQDVNHSVWRPRIRFKERPLRFCPFLINELSDDGRLKGFCRLHPHHKPLICALAPVGCEYDSRKKQASFLLVPPAARCPGMEKETHNKLHILTERYREALRYQSLYFELLELLKSKHLTEEDYREHLYTFKVNRPFKEIFFGLMRKIRGWVQMEISQQVVISGNK
ncbi:MAG: hypothetical protein GXO77_07715 [Calditrichaeota bacterium]|nr:hypothetical protein [Calditrichota bacterium]